MRSAFHCRNFDSRFCHVREGTIGSRPSPEGRGHARCGEGSCQRRHKLGLALRSSGCQPLQTRPLYGRLCGRRDLLPAHNLHRIVTSRLTTLSQFSTFSGGASYRQPHTTDQLRFTDVQGRDSGNDLIRIDRRGEHRCSSPTSTRPTSTARPPGGITRQRPESSPRARPTRRQQ
jgi:hypothetical protein